MSPTKRRKIECDIERDVEMKEPAPLRHPPRPPSEARFFPRRANQYNGPFCELTPLTSYQKHLANTFFGSINPADERVLHFSDKPKTVKHTLPPDRNAPPYPKCRISLVRSVEELPDDFYSQALAYDQSNDCLALILNGAVVLARGDLVHELSLPDGLAKSIAFDPDGNALLVSFEDGRLVGYSLAFDANGIQSQILCETNRLSPCTQILISDSSIFVGTRDGRIARINKSNILDVGEYAGRGTSGITGLALSPSGQRLLAADNDGIVTLFDPNVVAPIHTLKAFDSGVKAMAFSPCGRYFAAGGGHGDPRVALFAIEDGKIREIESHHTSSQATALFWQNNFVFSTHKDGCIRTFSIAPNSPSYIGPPELHEVPVHGSRLSYAALKRQRPGRDTLIVGCGQTGQVFEVDFQMPRDPKKASPLSRYDTIR